MNKIIEHIVLISKAAVLCHFSPFENIKANLIKFGLALFIHREHSAFNFHSDSIEQETTKGGLTLIKSMIQIPLSFKLSSTCNALPAPCDLTQPKDNAAKLNSSSIIDTCRNSR